MVHGLRERTEERGQRVGIRGVEGRRSACADATATAGRRDAISASSALSAPT
jgi:hypothetical protein